MTKRAFSKHRSASALAIIDYGLMAETLELGNDDHIAKVREFLGPENCDAISPDSMSLTDDVSTRFTVKLPDIAEPPVTDIR